MRDWDDDEERRELDDEERRKLNDKERRKLDDEERRELDEDETDNESLRHWRPGALAERAISGEGQDAERRFPAIEGFDRSKALSNADVANHLAELPSDHTDGRRIATIEYTDKYALDPKTKQCILGVCSTDADRVSRIAINRQEVNGSFDAELMRWTITHEVAHNVHAHLDAEKRERWNQLHESSAHDEFVTDYAKTDADEDFAESYAAYVHAPDLLHSVSREKYEFMARNVFT